MRKALNIVQIVPIKAPITPKYPWFNIMWDILNICDKNIPQDLIVLAVRRVGNAAAVSRFHFQNFDGHL